MRRAKGGAPVALSQRRAFRRFSLCRAVPPAPRKASASSTDATGDRVRSLSALFGARVRQGPGKRVPQADRSDEDGPIQRGIPIAHEIALTLELHRLVTIGG